MTDAFLPHRRRLLGVAYRMLGSLPEAEDVVQDAWLRWSARDGEQVRDVEAFLVTVVTRLCLDVLGSARRRRVDHVGARLPEPALTDRAPLGPLEAVEQRETLSLALLDLLEQCPPKERAAWVLREAFELPYEQIAGILKTSPAAVRQLRSRAARRLTQHAPARVTRPTPRQRQEILDAFLAAAASGRVEELAALLVEDAILVSDGGGRVTAARRPVHGRDRVARFLAGLVRKAGPVRLEVADAVGGPVVLVFDGSVLTHLVEIEPAAGGGCAAVRMVCDPLALDVVAHALGCHTVTWDVVSST